MCCINKPKYKFESACDQSMSDKEKIEQFLKETAQTGAASMW